VTPQPYTLPNFDNGQPLVYTIRFQNTGKYPAETVRILDTLSDKLGPRSIDVISSSHPYVLGIRDGRIAEFTFNAINLPDSSASQTNSHGFVRFSIRPASTDIPNDIIQNTAFIYFDFNPPVSTNTVVSNIAVSGTSTPLSLETALRIAPNPASDCVTFRLPESVSGPGILEIFAESGRLVHAEPVPGGVATIGVNMLPPGVYYGFWHGCWGKFSIQRN
jgi:uncharacterized repeat protein (TIGR01451 family)